MTGHGPLDDGPLRAGFRWQQRVVHNRKLCRTLWTVEAVVRGRVLEQARRHHCADSGRTTDGGERWDFADGGDSATVVTLRSRRTPQRN